MDKIYYDSAAREDLIDWLHDQENIKYQIMQTKLLNGKVQEAMNAAAELTVYQALVKRFKIEENERKDLNERKVKNG
jgi:hypothetical protein